MPATQPCSRPSLLLALTAMLWLAGCATTQTGGTGPASDDRAARLERRGDHAGAARMYEQLASANPAPARNGYAQSAARAWLAANRADDAQRALDLSLLDQATPPQRFEDALLRAQVGVARGQYTAAWQQVSQLPEPARASDATRLFQLRQQVALRAGQPVEAVRAQIARERVASSDTERARARRELLADLRAAMERGLRVNPSSASDPLVRGWLELGQVAVSAGRSPLDAQSAIDRWRARFPGHPGSTIATAEIINPGERTFTGPMLAEVRGPIALLLPLSTRQYAAPAALIRDGFQAALERLPAAERPVLRVYDTGAMPVGTALATAQAEGASFVVGPLTRAEAQTAAEQRPAGLPLLLLNTLDGSGSPGPQLYQYALSPEDEARQIARQITGSGQRNAVVLAPAGEWGTRIATVFADELTRSGGNVVARGIYDLSRNDLTAALTTALGVDAARARHRRLQQVTGATLLFEVQPRPDVEAIFVAGYQPLALRQINPQLRFFNAGSLPAYITQDGVDVDTNGNRDLEGMRLLETPWALDSVGPVADLRTATQQSWGPQGARQSRYFAFGYDAATLALELRRGGTGNWPLSGLTGRLQLASDGRVERSLNWARMHEGTVQAFDPAN